MHRVSQRTEERAGTTCTVAPGLVRPLIDLGEQAGVRTGVELGADGSVTLADYFRLRSKIADAVRDETCHLSARQLLPGSTSFVLSHLPARGSLCDVMRSLADAYNLLHGGEFNRIEVADSLASFVIDDTEFPYTIENSDQICFSMETTLIFLYAVLTLIVPGAAIDGLRRVAVRRQGEGAAPSHLAVWQRPVDLGADHYALRFDLRAAEHVQSLAGVPPLTQQTIDQRIVELAEGHGLADRTVATEAIVRSLLDRGLAEQAGIAEELGISPATLRRHLTQEGVRFRDLRREILNGKACRALRRPGAITEVASALGFADVRSFNRAFKSWNGCTPSAYRAANRTCDAD